MAMKMSSPKNSADVVDGRAVRADQEANLIRQRPVARFGRAPSAIGATSGRTICACPPSDA